MNQDSNNVAFEDLVWLFTSDTNSRGVVRLNIAEAAMLYRYCKKVKDGTLLEIGRKHGGSTVLMAAALERGFLYSVDIVLHDQATNNMRPWKDKAEFITGDSKFLDWETNINLLFIDGDHSYKGVKNDIKKFSPFVKSGGYIIFHDVIGKKSILQPLIDKLLNGGWTHEAQADSMLVLQRE